MGGILAIDLGRKKSGFATADALRVSLAPLPACRADATSAALLEHVAGLVAERDVTTVLIGMPFLMDGSEGEAARLVRAFEERLKRRLPGLEVCAYDERLTTKEAESRLRESGRTRAQRAAQKDSWSALVLLEDWIASGEPRH